MQDRCVYIWINDTTNKPFYVGCGKLNRPNQKYNRSKLFYDVYNNNKCHYEILKAELTTAEAAELERQTIKEFRDKGYELVNQTNGGEMRQYSNWTDEMRKEYAERLIGKNNPNYGNRWSEEQRKHLSEVRIELGIAKGSLNPRAKPVMCVETGEIFNCQQDAKDFLGVADPCASIWICLKNPKRVAGKGRYHFVGKEMFNELSTEEKRKEWLEKMHHK